MPVPESDTDTSVSASPTNAVSNLMLREPGAQFSTASSPDLPSRTIAPPASV
jgi:hypothetical protein